ncbi:hypothetical protein [Fuchsiella alkaliacetigena]|uniref:hypothetical protein n=1 Tax=Fuchsiella alkaliacetigena TaxID=957042 RepID=UPI00200B7C5D|nr:hypothetical protein [Fuchsiella alkaliacetigena]MCK8824304.1 hypothetical protein [Fuchsiella alkaliacetigena]
MKLAEVFYHLITFRKYMLKRKMGKITTFEVSPAKINLYNGKPHTIFKERCKKIYHNSSKKELIALFFNERRLIKDLFVVAGDWDLEATPFVEHETYQQMEELHRYNYNYEKTERYQEMMALIEDGESVKHKGPKMKSKEEVINRYFKRYISVFKSMEANGYLDKITDRIRDDLGRAGIGRNGEIIKMDKGRHRLAIAKILDIDTIPLKINYIHPQWIKKQLQQSSVNELNLDILRKSLKVVQERYNQDDLFTENNKANIKQL